MAISKAIDRCIAAVHSKDSIKRFLPWIITPVLFAMASFGYNAVNWKREWALVSGTAPVIEFDESVDIGPKERGAVVHVRFSMANRGGRDLLIDGIQASCACTGLEREIDGEFVRQDQVTVGPGKTIPLVLRFKVQGAVDSVLRAAVRFHCNDPSRPEGRIEVVVPRILAGVEASPSEVVFGTLLEGDSAKMHVHLRDSSIAPRRILKVESSNPDRFRVRLVDGPVASQESVPPGVIVGVVEVLANTARPGSLDGVIEIHVDDKGRAPDLVHVRGHVRPWVELTPSVLVLPRQAGNTLAYYAECYCATTNGRPFRLHAVHVPADFSLQIERASDGTESYILRLRVHEAFVKAGLPVTLRLRAENDDREAFVELPIIPRPTIPRSDVGGDDADH